MQKSKPRATSRPQPTASQMLAAQLLSTRNNSTGQRAVSAADARKILRKIK